MGNLLGRGTSGRVYEGMWKQRRVAIKKTFGTTHTELNILQSLSHPNIITFYGFALGDISTSIVMELAKYSLYQHIHRDGNVPSNEQRFQWMRDIALGMEYLHSINIVHRDLKSLHVLFSETDDLETAKLSDFGTAREMDHTTQQTCTTLCI